MTQQHKNVPFLRKGYCILTSLATLFLIFAGSMVTSTGSGLAVPDWPLSYGMLFPPMVAGVFYEHGHRLVAATVGFMTLVMAAWLGFAESRRWVRNLGYIALLAVIAQGLLGGITVIYMLPTVVSVCHAVLAQTFLLITITLAYSQTKSWQLREHSLPANTMWKFALFSLLVVYVQLIVGAWMRHTQAGMAIYDFPLAAGQIIPSFNQETVAKVNDWWWNHNLDYYPVALPQIIIHFAHRVGALLVTMAILLLNYKAITMHRQNWGVLALVFLLDFLLVTQITLGAFVIWNEKAPHITSFHVVNGAAILGVNMLLILRTYPSSSLGQSHE